MPTPREQKTVSSALWAAYGDALGFPTELATPERVEERLGVREIRDVMPWKRLVGGQFGAHVELPAGAYSDDTQLRMCVCRALRSDGFFDIEAFSKIELPVWLCYSLGAGKGSKVGANALGNRTTAWFSNFFDQNGADYLHGGGNGAAMRIQPHVWMARDLSSAQTYIPDVLKNTICTHGHARAIAGASIHAVSLASTLRTAVIPAPDRWLALAEESIEATMDAIHADNELSTFWLPTWEDRTGKSLRSELDIVKDEWKRDVTQATKHLDAAPQSAYIKILHDLHGLDPQQRGSGLKSALFALVVAWLYRDSSPVVALRTSANVLMSDTDTISSMAGALLGARLSTTPMDIDVQDASWIAAEGSRLARESEGRGEQSSFAYPDLLKWTAPRSQLDCVGFIDKRWALAGLGWLEPIGAAYKSGKNDVAWQWFQLEFGQKVLCKVRTKPQNMVRGSYPAAATSTDKYVKPSHYSPPLKKSKSSLPSLFDPLDQPTTPPAAQAAKVEPSQKKSIDELTDEAIRFDFDPSVIGAHILEIAARNDSLELAVAYVAVVVKARSARLRRKNPDRS